MTNPFSVAPRCVQWASVILIALPAFLVVVATQILPDGIGSVMVPAFIVPLIFSLALALGLVLGLNIARLVNLAQVAGALLLKAITLAAESDLEPKVVYSLVTLGAPALSVLLTFLPSANRYFSRDPSVPGASPFFAKKRRTTQSVAPTIPGQAGSPAQAPAGRRKTTIILSVTAGLVAMAFVAKVVVIPAYREERKIRMDTELAQRASSENTIRHNLRTLAGVAATYCMENDTGTARLSDLVGPNRLISDLKPVAGETYPTTFTRGGRLVAVMPDGVRITLDASTGVVERQEPPDRNGRQRPPTRVSPL